MYVLSGLATELVLIFGAVLTFGGIIRRNEKSCKEGVRLIQCFPHTTRCCACFRDYAHTSSIWGYLYSGGGGGGCTFGALQPTAMFSKNRRGTYFWRGTYLQCFTVTDFQNKNATWIQTCSLFMLWVSVCFFDLCVSDIKVAILFFGLCRTLVGLHAGLWFLQVFFSFFQTFYLTFLPIFPLHRTPKLPEHLYIDNRDVKKGKRFVRFTEFIPVEISAGRVHRFFSKWLIRALFQELDRAQV